VLADFRSWLEQLAAAGETAAEKDLPGVDLHTLVGQFVALRHEVHLQTRAVRSQQEQNAEALRRLGEALDALHDTQSEPEEPEPEHDERLRPLVKTLLDVYDALALAGREMQRIQEAIQTSLQQLTASSAPTPSVAEDGTAGLLPLWARWLGVDRLVRDALEQQRAKLLQADQGTGAQRQQQQVQTLARVGDLLDSAVTGFTMSLQRVERALVQHGLEPIPSVGQQFDPELMEVVEAVNNSGKSSGEVVAEVRRGYLWGGRVFRYAQVSVAKS